ncbi:uncharacterized protein LOC105843196 isoform X2 [Hydra vulgaris]|uniref:uncharacterized protein LOC105843196 isoform X2 n=1 Tax=Hydra vulgaris TaxID=6087 RepID=UPI0032EA34C8
MMFNNQIYWQTFAWMFQLWFLLDSSVFATDLKTNCGSNTTFINLSGKIRFPSIGNKYSNSVECRWEVDVAPNILRVEINYVDMEDNDKCKYGYIAFFDEPTYQNEISRYCSNKHVVLFAKSGILYIKVVTDNNSVASGFTLTWNSSTAVNSQVLVSPKIKNEAYLSSSSYYDINLNQNLIFKCEASGTPSPFVYWSYYQKLSEKCIFIENGLNSSYLKIIGCKRPLSKIFTCHATSIAGTDEKYGHIKIFDLQANCGNDTYFTNLSGKIHFPLIENEYSNDVECRWVIDVAPKILRVEINDLDMGNDGKDCYDYVAFYDDPTYQNKIESLCKVKHIVKIYKSGILYIKVSTNSGKVSPGFIVTWNSTENSQVLVSPKIKHETYFSGLPFYVEKSNATINCKATGTPAPLVYWTFFGKLSENCILPQKGLSSSDLKIINCKSSFSKKFACIATSIAGRQIKVVELKISDLHANCGNVSRFTSFSGKIRFPLIGNEYSNDVECTWVIDVAPNILRVELNDVDMEFDKHICHDSVSLYDDPTYQKKISFYCTIKQVVIFHKSGILYIKVITNRVNVSTGFILTWNSTTAVNSQVFVSPKIKSEAYFSEGSFFAEKSNATINCEATGTPAPFVYWSYSRMLSENCIFIQNGLNSSYLKIISCKSSFSKIFTCHAKSIAGNDKNSVLVKIFDVNANCGNYSSFTDLSGKIRFPSIGNKYSDNVECRWMINVAPNILRVDINDIDLRSYKYCYDYLIFYDDRFYENEISFYCKNKHIVLYRKSGILYIRVVTGRDGVGKGFILTWNSTKTENSQVFVSPKIKNETYFSEKPYYYEKSNATFKCEASGTPAPFVYWDYSRKLEENCILIEKGFNLSYLKIIDCQGFYAIKFSCHATSIAGTDEKVAHINLSDLKTNCGSGTNFTNLSGKIQFPLIGDKYSPNLECKWVIDVAPNILSVILNDVDMEYSDTCGYDYVVFFYDSTYQNEICRYCSNKHVMLFFKSSILYIKVVTNLFDHQSGFTLTWNSTTAINSQVLVSPKIKNEIYFSGLSYHATYSNVTFKCEASGTPAPFVYWDYRGKLSENCIFIENGFSSSYLKIISCQDSLSKMFSCYAKSIAGTDEKVADIKLSDSPFAPLVFLLPWTRSSLILKWPLIPPSKYGEKVTRYIIKYYLTKLGTSNKTQIEILSNFTSDIYMQYNLNGLTFEEYTVQVYGMNIYGSGQPYLQVFNPSYVDYINQRKEFSLPSSFFIETLNVLNNIYTLSFNVKPIRFPKGCKNIVQLSFENTFESCSHGYLSIGFHNDGSGKLIISSSENAVNDIVSDPLPMGQWSNIKIYQSELITGLLFAVDLNGANIYRKHFYTIYQEKHWKNVKVYGIYFWDTEQDGFISDLLIINQKVDYFVDNHNISLAHGNIVAQIPLLDKEFLISFNVFPQYFDNTFGNIIYFNKIGYKELNNNGILKIDFSNNGRLFIDFKDVGIYSTKPIELNMWCKVEIIQTLKSTKYVYIIKVNEEIVFYKINDNAQSFLNIKVYASSFCDFSHKGLIQNFFINSNQDIEHNVLVPADYINYKKVFTPTQGSIIGSIKHLDNQFTVSFNLKRLISSEASKNVLNNVFYLTSGNNDFDEKDNRVLNVCFWNDGSDKLNIYFAVNAVNDFKVETDQLIIGQWYNIKISQRKQKGLLFLAVDLNGNNIKNVTSIDLKLSFNNIKVYASNSWDMPINSLISDLLIVNGNAEYVVGNIITPLVKGKLIAHIPKLYNEYFVSFDVYPKNFDAMQNVIDFTIGTYSQKNNNSILGIWFHENNEKKGLLSISSDNFKLGQDSCIHSSPIGQNIWSNIEVRQTNIGANYVYTIRLNGVNVFSKNISQAKIFDNVNVYASNTWNENANGSVKNFFIVNGNSKEEVEKIKILSNVCDLCFKNNCENDTNGFLYCECPIGYVGDGYSCIPYCFGSCKANQQCVVKNNEPLCECVKDSCSASLQTYKLITILVSVLVVLIITVTMVVVVVTRNHRRKEIWNKDVYIYRNYADYFKSAPDDWEISPESFVFDKKIGEGAFGNVFIAKINAKALSKTMFAKQSEFVSHDENNQSNVAVKLLKDGANCSEFEDFREEIDLMKGIGYHKYIVNMIGCSRIKSPMCLILEYMENGDLLHFLKNRRTKWLKNTCLFKPPTFF